MILKLYRFLPLTLGLLPTLSLGIVLLGSCSSQAPSSDVQGDRSAVVGVDSTVSNTETKLKIVTTFLPMTQFTKAVAGDRAEVTQLLPSNIGPHDYQAKPEDAQRLAKADLVIQNGLEMEHFLEGLLQNTGNTKLQIIDSSKGVQTLGNEADGDAAKANHGNDKEHSHGQEHSHEQAHSHDREHSHSHDHGEFNPHIWLDPKRAIQQVETIRDALIKADPEGQAIYTANAVSYISKLQALDQEITQTLQPYAGKTFVTYHDFAPYFADSYGLKTEFLVDVPDENPTPSDVQRVVNAAKNSNLKTLLTESQAVNDPFAALAKDLKVNVSTFDPIEVAGPEGLEPEYYLTVMRSNLMNLKTAFAGS